MFSVGEGVGECVFVCLCLKGIDWRVGRLLRQGYTMQLLLHAANVVWACHLNATCNVAFNIFYLEPKWRIVL